MIPKFWLIELPLSFRVQPASIWSLDPSLRRFPRSPVVLFGSCEPFCPISVMLSFASILWASELNILHYNVLTNSSNAIWLVFTSPNAHLYLRASVTFLHQWWFKLRFQPVSHYLSIVFPYQRRNRSRQNPHVYEYVFLSSSHTSHHISQLEPNIGSSIYAVR